MAVTGVAWLESSRLSLLAPSARCGGRRKAKRASHWRILVSALRVRDGHSRWAQRSATATDRLNSSTAMSASRAFSSKTSSPSAKTSPLKADERAKTHCVEGRCERAFRGARAVHIDANPNDIIPPTAQVVHHQHSQLAMYSSSRAPRAGSLRPQQTPVHHAAATHDHFTGAPACDDLAMAEEPEPSTSEDKDFNSFSDCTGGNSSPTTAAKKSVSWSTITVHEFGVGLGGSAVSNKGGPSIGLAQTPEFTWTTKVGEMAECVEGVHRFSRNQRIRLLQAAGIPDGIITRHARETNIILGSRRRSTTSWSDDEETDDEEELEGKEQPRKRSADQAMLERSCSTVYLRRPRMIPVNYV